jgi:hypothetical protein
MTTAIGVPEIDLLASEVRKTQSEAISFGSTNA